MKEHKNLKIFVFILSGSIMIGHGLRMLNQGIFHQNTSYFPNTFDLFFDWLSLAILGFIILYYGLNGFYQKQKNLNPH